MGCPGGKQETLLDDIGETSVFFFFVFSFFHGSGKENFVRPPPALIPRTDAAVGRIRRLGPACLQERR